MSDRNVRLEDLYKVDDTYLNRLVSRMLGSPRIATAFTTAVTALRTSSRDNAVEAARLPAVRRLAAQTYQYSQEFSSLQFERFFYSLRWRVNVLDIPLDWRVNQGPWLQLDVDAARFASEVLRELGIVVPVVEREPVEVSSSDLDGQHLRTLMALDLETAVFPQSTPMR